MQWAIVVGVGATVSGFVSLVLAFPTHHGAEVAGSSKICSVELQKYYVTELPGSFTAVFWQTCASTMTVARA